MPDSENSAVHSGESRAARCPVCGGLWPIAPAHRGYYFRARAWVAADRSARTRLSADRASMFRRIAALGDTWGVRLDELGASYGMVRWCGAPQYIADREKRYRALIALLEEHGQGRDVGKRFAALAAAMPAVGRWAERRRRR